MFLVDFPALVLVSLLVPMFFEHLKVFSELVERVISVVEVFIKLSHDDQNE